MRNRLAIVGAAALSLATSQPGHAVSDGIHGYPSDSAPRTSKKAPLSPAPIPTYLGQDLGDHHQLPSTTSAVDRTHNPRLIDKSQEGVLTPRQAAFQSRISAAAGHGQINHHDAHPTGNENLRIDENEADNNQEPTETQAAILKLSNIKILDEKGISTGQWDEVRSLPSRQWNNTDGVSRLRKRGRIYRAHKFHEEKETPNSGFHAIYKKRAEHTANYGRLREDGIHFMRHSTTGEIALYIDGYVREENIKSEDDQTNEEPKPLQIAKHVETIQTILAFIQETDKTRLRPRQTHRPKPHQVDDSMLYMMDDWADEQVGSVTTQIDAENALLTSWEEWIEATTAETGKAHDNRAWKERLDRILAPLQLENGSALPPNIHLLSQGELTQLMKSTVRKKARTLQVAIQKEQTQDLGTLSRGIEDIEILLEAISRILNPTDFENLWGYWVEEKLTLNGNIHVPQERFWPQAPGSTRVIRGEA